MSDTSDMMIKYEEDNWQDLAEKFIEKHRDEWEQYVYEQFEQAIADQEPPDYDDDYHGEDKGFK